MLPPRTHASGAGKRKTARTSGAVMLCRGDFLSGIRSRASSLATQSTVASPARLLDPVVSGSLLMQVPIIVETPPPVKSFFEHFRAGAALTPTQDHRPWGLRFLELPEFIPRQRKEVIHTGPQLESNTEVRSRQSASRPNQRRRISG